MSTNEKIEVEFDSNELIAVCKYLYRQCAIDLDVDAEELNKITMERFVNWCLDRKVFERDRDELTARLNLRPRAWDSIHELFQGSPWACASVLYPIWLTVALQHRPPLRNGIGFVHVAVTVGYRDQRVGQIAGATEFAPGMAQTDGFLAALISSQLTTIVQQLAHFGFDRIHDEFAGDSSEQQADTRMRPVPPAPSGHIGWS